MSRFGDMPLLALLLKLTLARLDFPAELGYVALCEAFCLLYDWMSSHDTIAFCRSGFHSPLPAGL